MRQRFIRLQTDSHFNFYTFTNSLITKFQDFGTTSWNIIIVDDQWTSDRINDETQPEQFTVHGL